MRNERVLFCDDNYAARSAAPLIFEDNEGGHELVGQAASVSEVEELLEEGLRPTVALVDGKFPHDGDGERAAALIRKYSPETKVISFSTDEQNWGDESWPKVLEDVDTIMRLLTNLQH